MAQAKITVSAEQAKKLGLLTHRIKPVSFILYDPKSGVNLYQTGTGESITVPDGADLTNLKIFEDRGYFTVIEGEINTNPYPVYQMITVGGADNKTLVLTFGEPVYTAGVSSTGLGQETDDLIVLIDGVATAFTVAAVTLANAARTIVLTMENAPTDSVSVKITEAGALKITDVVGKATQSATRTYDMQATDFTFFTFDEEVGTRTINGLNHTIAITVEAGTDVTALVASFNLSPGATAAVGATEQVSGTTANDFTDPVVYTVTAHDGTTTQAWTVTVTVAA